MLTCLKKVTGAAVAFSLRIYSFQSICRPTLDTVNSQVTDQTGRSSSNSIMLSRIMVTGSQTAISQSHAKYPITDNGFHYWVLHDCHNIQGGPEKTAQTLMRYNFQQQVIESRGFQQNVQKQTGNTKKNSVRLLQLTILC